MLSASGVLEQVRLEVRLELRLRPAVRIWWMDSSLDVGRILIAAPETVFPGVLGFQTRDFVFLEQRQGETAAPTGVNAQTISDVVAEFVHQYSTLLTIH